MIQWVYGISEEGYGPQTRAKVRGIQERAGIPVDPEVQIGPRTWSLIRSAYGEQAAAVMSDAWVIPAEAYRLDGKSEAERFMRERIADLNENKIPVAAQYHIRNERIRQMKESGLPPVSPVDRPPVSDPAVRGVIGQLLWNQEKVDRLWQRARERGIDPRVLLAVLFQEGTGSFNTNASVPTQFWVEEQGQYLQGGSGVQPDFEQDLQIAMDQHILAKICAYGAFATAFQAACAQAGLGNGNLFQYVNYNVPWVTRNGWTVTPGCYATHTEWWKGLSARFDSLVFAGATKAYSEYLTRVPIAAPVSAPPPQVSFVLTRRGTGATEEIAGLPWIEATPA